MGTKRPHSAGDSNPHHENPARKRLRMNRPHKPKPAAVDLDSMNAIKKRARAIERLLARDNLNLPANKKNDLERELAAHRQRIEDAKAKKERGKWIAKYHMVRFFERKKAMRFVKQLEKKISQATDPEEIARLKADLHIAEVDIDYAKYFPFMEPYISLYAGATKEKDEDKNAAALYLRTPRPPMWTLIEKTREEGQAALEKLQNRRPQTTPDSEATEEPEEKRGTAQQPADRKLKVKKKGPRQQRREMERAARDGKGDKADKADGDGDESDGGGFFE